MYKTFIKPLLFLFSAEKAHHLTIQLLKITLSIPIVSFLFKKSMELKDDRLRREVFGLTFQNPVGLAAGFDKDGKSFNAMSSMGFGFIELGTVTPKAQGGNPQPRLFRVKKDEGIINRMGFNNEGIEAVIKNLKKNKGQVIIGGNIGKNTTTSPENYTEDYCEVFKSLHPYVDYFVLNVSCPNVGSHAKLNDKDYLIELITACKELNLEEKSQKPILLKIAPDLNTIQLDEIIELVNETNIDGVIASNTSTSREGLKASKEQLAKIGPGGLSGQPVKNKSTEVIQYLADTSHKSFPIIGVGGIHSEKDALEKIKAGADLVQVYTGFIYEGPSLIKRINKAILQQS